MREEIEKKLRREHQGMTYDEFLDILEEQTQEYKEEDPYKPLDFDEPNR